MSEVPGVPEGLPPEELAEVTEAEASIPLADETPIGQEESESARRGPEAEPGAEPEPEPEPKRSSRRSSAPPEDKVERPSIIDAVADLMQFIVDWLRQEAEAIMHDKVVIPGQKLGLTLASGCAAAMLLAFGLCFIATGLFILLGEWLTYPGALLLIGGVLVLGALIFTAIKMRSMQK